jgi:hypothetical protein
MNPHAEVQDIIASDRPSQAEVKAHVVHFDKALHRIRINAFPIKKMVVPTRWADRDAIDRTYHVFDIEGCPL